jgi:hypothetical protein
MTIQAFGIYLMASILTPGSHKLKKSSILQALGIVGTPFGMGQYPTDIGTLATLIPIATGALGATGGFGALANLGLSLLGGFRRQPA